MSWRLLDFEYIDPYEAYALVETLTKSKSPNSLLFYTSPAYVVFGKNSPRSSVNIEECRRRNIPIIRAMHGRWGPMLYHQDDLHTVFFYNIGEGRYPLSDVNKLVISTIIKVCEILGLTAERSTHRPNSNDIVIGSKKVAGITNFQKGSKVLAGATLAFEFDYDMAAKVLNIPSAKFADKPQKTVNGWVTSLRKELGRVLSMEELKTAFVQAFENEHEATLKTEGLTEEERKLAAGLMEKYTSEIWIRSGKWSPVKEYWRPK